MHINKGENIPFFGRIYMFINFLIISFGISGSALLVPLVNGSTMFSILILSIVISFFLDTSGFAENFKKYKGNLIIVFMIFCVFNLFITKSIFIGSNLFNYIYIFGYFAIFIYYKKRDRERKIFVKLIIIDIFLKVIISLSSKNLAAYWD